MLQEIPRAIALALALTVIIAAVTDVRSRRIPNWLTVLAFLAGLVLNTAIAGWSGLGAALLGFGLAVVIHVPLFALRLTGGGDVKLMAATGALLGPHPWLTLFILSSIAGGVHALILITLRRAAGGVVWNLIGMARSAVLLRMPFQDRAQLDIGHEKALSVPRAVSVAIGAAIMLWMAL